MYFFTDLDEYYKCYPTEDENTVPVYWDFSHIDNLLYGDTCGIIINPKSDNFFIPQDVLWHILQDEIEIQNQVELNLNWYKDDFLDRNKIYSPEDLLNIENERTNGFLLKYIGDKKYFTRYTTLFDYFRYSTLYFILQFDEELDFEGDYYKPKFSATYKKDGYIMVFMDLDSLKEEIKDKDKFYYYGIADMLWLTEIVLNFDWEGIILHNGEREIILPRKHFLKHFDNLRLNCNDFALIEIRHYIFKIGD